MNRNPTQKESKVIVYDRFTENQEAMSSVTAILNGNSSYEPAYKAKPRRSETIKMNLASQKIPSWTPEVSKSIKRIKSYVYVKFREQHENFGLFWAKVLTFSNLFSYFKSHITFNTLDGF